MTTELFRKEDMGYNMTVYSPDGGPAREEWVPDIQETLCTPTGRWKTIDKNGDIKLHLEVEHSRHYSIEKTEYIERKWLKFLGLKKVKRRGTKTVQENLWVSEDDLIYVETTINKCCSDDLQP